MLIAVTIANHEMIVAGLLAPFIQLSDGGSYIFW